MIKNYKIFIYDEDSSDYVDYSKHLQLPFTITEKADEAYDMGSLVLTRLNREEPFRAETPVKIEIYESLLLIDTYYMQVEADVVNTFYTGIRKHYTHSIDIIELTKKLDKLFLPDFTITNPATKSITRAYERENGNFDINMTISSGNYEMKSAEFYFNRELVDIPVLGSTTHRNEYFNMTYKTNIPIKEFVSNFPVQPKKQRNGSYIELPIPYFGSKLEYKTTGTIKSKVEEESKDEFTTAIDTTYNQDKVNAYYYYKNTDSQTYIKLADTSIDLATGECTVRYIYDESRFKVVEGKLYFIIGPNGNENINLKIDIDLINNIPNIYTGLYQQFEKMLPSSYMIQAMYDAFSYYYKQSEGRPYYGDSVRASLNTLLTIKDNIASDTLGRNLQTLFNESRHSLTVNNTTTDTWVPGGDIVNTNTTVNSELLKNIKYASITGTFSSAEDAEPATDVIAIPYKGDGYKTIKDVLEKINIMLEEDDKFSIETDNTLLDTAIPEKIYSNRNVAEILFELGTLIGSYPYLDDKNTLSFKRVVPKDNPNYEDSDTENVMSTTFDNAVNEYYTNVSNMITSPDKYRTCYSYWPSRNYFAYPNGKWEDGFTTPDNNQIVISNSNGIYYLKYIKVKNCLKEDSTGNNRFGPDTVIDLTNYCPEANYYNTLYVKGESVLSNTNKSNCIYWTKGSNVITLGELEATEKVNMFGEVAADTYKLTRAILYAGRETIPDLDESDISSDTVLFKFQICYIDYMSGLIKNKKFNQESKNDIISNYNQTDNNISSQEWLNNAQINILRRGNDNLVKTDYITNMNNKPLLGEIKIENGVKYLADTITYTFDNNVLGVSINYTKNYNKIDPLVSLSKDYRQFEIYGKESVTRTVNIDRYVYMDFEKHESSGNFNYNFLNAYNVNKREKIPEFAILYFKDKDKKQLKYYRMLDTPTTMPDGTKKHVEQVNVLPIVVPLTYTAGGNSIILTADLLDNYTAGYYIDDSDEPKLAYYDIFGTKKDSGAYRLKTARYVDDLGEAEYVSIYIIRNDKAAAISSLFPNTTMGEGQIKQLGYYLDYEEDIPIKKDNREKMKFVYQLHYLTHSNDIKWNPALCKYLFYDQEDQNEIFLDNGGKLSNSTKTSYYGIFYNMLNDTILPSTLEDDNDPSYSTFLKNVNINSDNISMDKFTPETDLKSVALVYPRNREIIYHINRTFKAGEEAEIPPVYFTFSNKKI